VSPNESLKFIRSICYCLIPIPQSLFDICEKYISKCNFLYNYIFEEKIMEKSSTSKRTYKRKSVTFEDDLKVPTNTPDNVEPFTPEKLPWACYCGDESKKITSKNNSKEYLVCPNSRYVNGVYVKDCEFFVAVDQLTGKICKCGLPSVEFQSKAGKLVTVCAYKNAPTTFKKANNYKCEMINIK